MEKEAISKMKRQPTEWEEIFANHVSNKELISKIYIQNPYNSIAKKKKDKFKEIQGFPGGGG